MIISDTYRTVFVHLPKCAGTTVRRALEPFDETGGRYAPRVGEHPETGPLDFTHIPLDLLARIAPEDYAKVESYESFAIVRDPAARFRSGISQWLKMYGAAELAQASPAEIERAIAEVTAYMADPPEIFRPDYIYFRPQVDFVDRAGARVVGQIFPLERVDLCMAALAGRIEGLEAGVQAANRTRALRIPALRPAYAAAGRMARALLPRAAVQGLRDRARALLMKEIAEDDFPIFRSDMLMRFLADTYGADFDLHAEALARVGR